MAKIIVAKETGNLVKGEEAVRNIRLWQSRIRSHLEWIKKHWNGWDSWKASYLLDRAIHWGTAETLKEKSQDLDAEIVVPLIANHIRNLMPFLFSKDPIFYGIPIKGDSEEDIANTMAQLDYLNAKWEEHGMSRQAKRSILDAAIIGHGVARTGWGYELELPTTSTPEKGEINFLDYIREDSPYVRRVNPFLFLFDRTSPDSDLSSARWCSEFIIQTVQDLIDNELYDEKVRNKIASGEVDIMRVHEFNSKYHQETEEDLSFLFKGEEKVIGDIGTEIEIADTLCIVYRVYDRKFGNVFTLNPSYDKEVLSVDSWQNTNSHLPNFPFVKVDFEEVPNEPYGIGHSRYLADLQHQTNRNRTKIYAITRMFNPKYVYKGTEPLAQEEQEKIKEDEAGVTVNLKPDATIDLFPTPQVSKDLYEASAILDKDYSEVSGEDVLARGGLLPSRTSAEEIRERRRLRGLRLETNVENTHAFVLTLANQILLHAKRYATQKKVVEVIGRPGVFWNTITPEQLKNGETKLKLELISKEVESPDTKRRTLLELFQMIANPNIYQLLQSQGVQINMRRLWKALMDTYNIDELQHIFPGLNESTQLPDLNLMNQGNPPAIGSNGSPESTREIQGNNVSLESLLQGGRGIESLLGGNLNPSRF